MPGESVNQNLVLAPRFALLLRMPPRSSTRLGALMSGAAGPCYPTSQTGMEPVPPWLSLVVIWPLLPSATHITPPNIGTGPQRAAEAVRLVRHVSAPQYAATPRFVDRCGHRRWCRRTSDSCSLRCAGSTAGSGGCVAPRAHDFRFNAHRLRVSQPRARPRRGVRAVLRHKPR